MTPPNIEDVAAQWAVELSTSERTPELWAEFRKWLSRDPANIDAFLKMEEAWRALNHIGKLTEYPRNLGAGTSSQIDTKETSNSLTP